MKVQIFEKAQWHANRWLLRRLHLGEMTGLWLTVRDEFGAPGDTLLTATVCRNLRTRFPRLKINCITPNPDLLEHDPNIDALNGPATYPLLRHWYLELLYHKKGEMNVLEETMRAAGIHTYDQNATVYLTHTERTAALARLELSDKPMITVNTRSKEPVKNWAEENWRQLVDLLVPDYSVTQLGDAAELALQGVQSFAGRLTFRESMAVLSHARAHAGPDSFLMHAANGLGIPSAILYGGSRTPMNTGYPNNINLYAPMPCGPCYIHQTRGETCVHGVECMKRITVEDVYKAIITLAPLPSKR